MLGPRPPGGTYEIRFERRDSFRPTGSFRGPRGSMWGLGTASSLACRVERRSHRRLETAVHARAVVDLARKYARERKQLRQAPPIGDQPGDRPYAGRHAHPGRFWGAARTP